MHANVASIDNCGQRQCIEELHELFVEVLIKVVGRLASEVHLLRHLPRLVVTAQQEHVVGVLCFERHQKGAHFQRAFASVHIVAQEKILRLLGVSRDQTALFELLQHLHHVVKLAVDVANDHDFTVNLDHIRLFLHNLATSFDELEDKIFSHIAAFEQPLLEKLQVDGIFFLGVVRPLKNSVGVDWPRWRWQN